MWGGDETALTLCFTDGVATWVDGEIDYRIRTQIDHAVAGPDGNIYATQAGRILCLDGNPLSARDVTDSFGGPAAPDGRVVLGSGGQVYIQGCRSHRRLDGGFAQLPADDEPDQLLPPVADLFGNLWNLGNGTSHALVLPADRPDRWNRIDLPAGTWTDLVVDHLGFLWIAGPCGARRFPPRSEQATWQTPDGIAADATVSALGLSPDGLPWLGLETGDLLELDIDAEGVTHERRLGHVPAPPRCLHTDTQGILWVATDDGLYRDASAADDRHENWVAKPGRLPGGGNHDIFSVAVQNQLFVAGGLSRFWGYPTSQHVFDELFRYDPDCGCWEIVHQMSFPRRYNGIAEMDGRVWIIGGEGELGERGGEVTTLDVVDIYDPASNTWAAGPRLNQVRTDPFVVRSGDRIWAIGGACDATTKLQTAESIGRDETSWRPEPDLPIPAREGGCCALDGVVYCASDDGFFAFDTGTGQWDVHVPAPEVLVKAPLMTSYRSEIWMMGGARQDRTQIYDPRSKTWRNGPRLPTQQSWGGAAVLEGRLYITGGAHRSERHDMTIYDDRTWVLR